MKRPNKPHAANRAIPLRLHTGRPGRGVADAGRSAAFALGRMKITMKSAISAAIAFFLITCPDLGAATDDWRYEVLAQDKVIKANAITSKAGDNLLEFKTISVGGFRTAILCASATVRLSAEPGWFHPGCKAPSGLFPQHQEWFASLLRERDSDDFWGIHQWLGRDPDYRTRIEGHCLGRQHSEA